MGMRPETGVTFIEWHTQKFEKGFLWCSQKVLSSAFQ